MKVNQLFESEDRIDGMTRQQAENSVKLWDEHVASMTKLVSFKPTKAQKKLFDEIEAELERLRSMSTKKIEAESGMKASKKHLSKEFLINNVARKKFGDEAFDVHVRMTAQKNYGANRTDWSTDAHTEKARAALKKFIERDGK